MPSKTDQLKRCPECNKEEIDEGDNICGYCLDSIIEALHHE